MMRVEHSNIPAYTFMLKAFLYLGIVLIAAAGVAALIIWL
jgi:hypothetical protein